MNPASSPVNARTAPAPATATEPTIEPTFTPAPAIEPQAALPAWLNICNTLRKTVGADAFQRWFHAATWAGHENGVATIAVPGEIHQVWIEANYLPELAAAVDAELGPTREVRVVLGETAAPEQSPRTGTTPHNSHRHPQLAGDALEKRLKAIGLNPVHTFSSFVVGANNQFAQAACEAVSRKAKTGYNPLFIHGASGLGKTHLLHALGQELVRKRPACRIVYLTCEVFINEFIDSVRRGDLEKFRRRYRQPNVLLIDDIQFLAGKERSQEEFFHTFNTLLDGRSQVILTSDRPASEIKSLEPRLQSRFECGLTVEIQPPQLETRLAILKQKSADWKVRLDDSIFLYLAENIRSNVRRLEGALMRVASFASLAGESVTVENIEPLLRDLAGEETNRQVSIDTIQRAVAEHYDIRLADMIGRRRPASIAFPRQVAMFLSRSLTKGSLMEIGEAFGGRDHGTVIHACKKLEALIAKEPGFKETLTRLEGVLRR